MQTKYSLLGYKIYLYFHEYKLAMQVGKFVYETDYEIKSVKYKGKKQ